MTRLPDFSRSYDLSIPVRFGTTQVTAFGADPASATPYAVGDTILDVGAGAGCNCRRLSFSPHLHGTHTECVGHISRQPYVVQEVIEHSGFSSAMLVSVAPVEGSDCSDGYEPALQAHDIVVTRDSLLAEVKTRSGFEALIIRTLPNHQSKTSRAYTGPSIPFLSNDAIRFVKELGVVHLLVDLPSLDRADDGGALSNHHLYWDVEQGSHEVERPSPKSITELIFVPNEVEDGDYLLSLNVSTLRSDAAPSRPTLYGILNP